MCSAGPEVAVLDWSALKQMHWQRGRGVVAGLQVACEAHIQGEKVLGHPPLKKIRPSYTDYIPGTSDFLCRFPLPGHSYILSPFHPYIAFMPVQFLMYISIITVYKVHYCIIIKHARSLNNSQTFHRIIRITLIYRIALKFRGSLIHARALKNPRN